MLDRVDETLKEIEVENWLTKTAEPNQQNAQDRRKVMAAAIREKLPRLNRKQVNDALSLKVSFDNNPEHQRLRRGIRAIILAHVALKNVPPTGTAYLASRWLGQTEDAIRRGFLACMPFHLDTKDARRQVWAAVNFTNPTTFPNWTAGAFPANYRYRFIVTCLPCDQRGEATLLAPNATIATWAAMSTSIISETHSYIYGHYGFVLHVPVENILVAASSDQDIKNHLGTALTRSPDSEASLSKPIKQGLLAQHLMDKIAAQGGRLKTPDECLAGDHGFSNNQGWTEVLICGRSPTTTRSTTISAVFLRVDSGHNLYRGMKGGPNSPISAALQTKIQTAAVSAGVPLIYIPDPSGQGGVTGLSVGVASYGKALACPSTFESNRQVDGAASLFA